MKKSEMTPEQLSRRERFVLKLVAARWEPGSWEELFEDGFALTPEAQAEYSNATLDMRLGYHASGDYVLLEFVGRDDPTALSLRCHPGGDLGAVLDAVISAQDSLSPDNYPEFVKTLVPLCDPLLLETPEGPVQLS